MTTATQTQIRRDTATNLLAATPAAGELAYDTTNKRVHIGDGSTAGGTRLPNQKDIQQNTFGFASAVGGTANAITLTFAPVTVADTAGQELDFVATSTNSASTTVANDSRSACTLKKIKNGALSNLEGGEIVSGGAYKIISLGSSNYFLTNPSSTSTNSGIDWLATVNASAAASVVFNSTYITSLYSKYILEFDGVYLSVATAKITMVISTNNGSSYIASGYMQNPAGTSSGGNNLNFSIGDVGSSGFDSSSTAVSQGTIKFSNPSASKMFIVEWTCVKNIVSTSGTFGFESVGGVNTFTTAINNVKLAPTTGAMTGNFRLYGLKN